MYIVASTSSKLKYIGGRKVELFQRNSFGINPDEFCEKEIATVILVIYIYFIYILIDWRYI